MPVMRPTNSARGVGVDVSPVTGDGCLASCTGSDTCTTAPTTSPMLKITVATRYASGQPDEK